MTNLLSVIGLGYVGVPLAREACRSGLRVVGIDIDPDVVAFLSDGKSHIDDVSANDVSEMLSTGFAATTDPSIIHESEVVVICVPTPLDGDGAPNLDAVVDASRTVGEHMRSSSLVVLESTTYPGTTDEVVRPLLESGSGLTAGVDFALAYSPERIDPGNRDWGFRNTPKVVAGLTPSCADQVSQFYGQLVDTVVPVTGLREAELAKLLENTYRHVNIALMNEMAVFCHELGIDIWAAADAAATKPFGFQSFRPGPGVGGHCIPIDPNYLSWVARSVGHRFRLVDLADEVSERMPSYVAGRVQDSLNGLKKPVNGSKVVLAGVTYKPNVSDQRQTPAVPVAKHLLEKGARLFYVDPYANEFLVEDQALTRLRTIKEATTTGDIVVVLQAHDDFISSSDLYEAAHIFDTTGRLSGPNVERL